MTPSKICFVQALLATALLLGLSACGSKDDKKVATQVAAKVDSEEISVHQINQVLSRSNSAGASPLATQAKSREVLEKLIDQQLAVEQALEAKLHRSPDVVAQLEAARREILARAYLQQMANALPKPSAEDSKKYYAEHPQLFSERRIFNVQEIVLPAGTGVGEQLRGFALAGKPIEETAAWLKARGIEFGGGSATRAAEQIPLELLARVHALKDGQSTLIETAQGMTLLRVAASQHAPLDAATALPRIEQFLSNQRATESVTLRLKQLRANAKITYMGEFAKIADAAAAQATSAPTATQAKTSIEKGVAGLK